MCSYWYQLNKKFQLLLLICQTKLFAQFIGSKFKFLFSKLRTQSSEDSTYEAYIAILVLLHLIIAGRHKIWWQWIKMCGDTEGMRKKHNNRMNSDVNTNSYHHHTVTPSYLNACLYYEVCIILLLPAHMGPYCSQSHRYALQIKTTFTFTHIHTRIHMNWWMPST